MFIGDFNFYCSTENKERQWVNMNDIITFNSIVNNLGLQEITLKGRDFTWSNMQQELLLEQFDWCFTSTNWISDFPNTMMLPLARTVSDHTPSMVKIGTVIPKTKTFRFECFWTEQPGFLEVVQNVWNSEVRHSNSATKVAAKFKLLRRVLKRWAMSLKP
jgi:hypothetical protein